METTCASLIIKATHLVNIGKSLKFMRGRAGNGGTKVNEVFKIMEDAPNNLPMRFFWSYIN